MKPKKLFQIEKLEEYIKCCSFVQCYLNIDLFILYVNISAGSRNESHLVVY